MTKLNFLVAAGAAALALSATAATAAITTFAQFSAIGDNSNVRWANNSVASNSTAPNTSSGTGGFFYTTTNGAGTSAQNVAVKFEFLQPQFASVGVIAANFLMNITVVESPAIAVGSNRIQAIPTGGFSFFSTQAFTVNSVFYGVGTNLLTASISDGQIAGRGTSGAFSGNTDDGTLTYSSQVLDFGNTSNRDFALSLTSITPGLFRDSGRALRTFRGLATGSFSSDPAPIVNAVPEPEIWGLLVVGFGLVGVQVRRRMRQSAVAA